MAIPVPIIDATGIHIPAYADILSAYQDAYRQVYGADVYLEPDSQDGQWIAIQAKAHADLCAAVADAYNAFSPFSAQGVGLSRVVKINGLKRLIASYSTVDLTLIGQAGSVVTDGQARDINGVIWSLPPTVTIPLSGEITVTANCDTIGAIGARPNTVTEIATPTAGWQSVTNRAAASPGEPVETDVGLRARQSLSTMNPSLTLMEGMQGAILAIPGVSRVRAYENDTNAADANGLPPHSIAFIVDGGDDDAIAAAISKKAPGGYTHGDTIVQVTDQFGIPHPIRFFRPVAVPITFKVTVRKLVGYTSDVGTSIQDAMAEWANAIGIGNPLRVARAYIPANLTDPSVSATYDVVTVAMARDGATTTASDIVLAFNEEPYSDASLVQIAFSA
jgi:uncharacterized phage protein gp47/JayE